MRARGEHALDRGKFFGDEPGDLLQARTVDDEQQVVGAGHEVARFDLVETADAVREVVETTSALGGDLHLDDGAHGGGGGGLTGEIEHRTPAEEDFVFLQLFQVLVEFGLGQACNLRHLRRREMSAFD